MILSHIIAFAVGTVFGVAILALVNNREEK